MLEDVREDNADEKAAGHTEEENLSRRKVR